MGYTSYFSGNGSTTTTKAQPNNSGGGTGAGGKGGYSSFYGTAVKAAPTGDQLKAQRQQKQKDDQAAQQQQQAQQKKQQADQAAKDKQNSFLNKATKVVKSLASGATTGEQKFATGIARTLPGGTNDLKTQAKQADSATKNIQFAKDHNLKPTVFNKVVKSNTQSADQAQQQNKATIKAMPSKAQIGLGAASTAADILTAGTFERGKAGLVGFKAAKEGKALKPIVTATGKKGAALELTGHLAANATAGGLNAAAGGGSKDEIIKNAAAGAALPEFLRFGGKGAAAVAKSDAVSNVTGKVKAPFGKDAATNDLLSKTRQAAVVDNATKTGSVGKLAVEKPQLDPMMQKSLDDTMSKVKAPDSIAKEANQVAASQAAEKAATEKSTQAAAKIDQKIELINAKKADGKFTNVDKVKVEQLKAEKEAVAPKSAGEAPATPAAVSKDVVAPTKAEAGSVVEKPASASLPNSTAAEAEKTTLKPSQTSHMESINGYTHSDHLAQDYADMLRGQELGVKGGHMKDTADGKTVTSDHSQFYRDFYKENKKAPTKADYLEQAHAELGAKGDAFGAHEDYLKLKERESKPIIPIAPKQTAAEIQAIKNAPDPEAKSVASKENASRVYERLKAEQPELKDDVSYEAKNLKQEAEKAVELIATDKQKAYRIAMGAEQSSEHLDTSVNIAMAEKALSEGNDSLYAQLVKSRSLAQTRRGQELVAEKGSITDNSTTRYVKELLAMRLSKVGNKYLSDTNLTLKKAGGKDNAMKQLDKQVAAAQQRVRGKTLQFADAQAIIDRLSC